MILAYKEGAGEVPIMALPCPQCGSDKALSVEEHSMGNSVFCDTCFEAVDSLVGSGRTPADAIASWNTLVVEARW